MEKARPIGIVKPVDLIGMVQFHSLRNEGLLFNFDKIQLEVHKEGITASRIIVFTSNFSKEAKVHTLQFCFV